MSSSINAIGTGQKCGLLRAVSASRAVGTYLAQASALLWVAVLLEDVWAGRFWRPSRTLNVAYSYHFNRAVCTPWAASLKHACLPVCAACHSWWVMNLASGTLGMAVRHLYGDRPAAHLELQRPGLIVLCVAPQSLAGGIHNTKQCSACRWTFRDCQWFVPPVINGELGGRVLVQGRPQ